MSSHHRWRANVHIDKRKAEAERIRQKYQDRIPVSLHFGTLFLARSMASGDACD